MRPNAGLRAIDEDSCPGTDSAVRRQMTGSGELQPIAGGTRQIGKPALVRIGHIAYVVQPHHRVAGETQRVAQAAQALGIARNRFGTDHPGAGLAGAVDHAPVRQDLHRLAHRATADREAFGPFELGGQDVTDLKPAGLDVLGNVIGNAPVQRCALRRSPASARRHTASGRLFVRQSALRHGFEFLCLDLSSSTDCTRCETFQQD